VPAGQVFGLLGPNGAGKTTTMHVLLGLMLPTSGRVWLLGHDVVADRSAALRDTNFTASYAAFPGRLTVREILRVYGELYEVDDPPRAIAEAAELVGVTPLLGTVARGLSSGQQTLVGLAKALLNRPRLLLLDEPTASLDPVNANEVRQVLRRVAAERGMSIFITSHNMVEVERLATRILFLSAGRLVADATAAELRQRFAAADLEEVFLQVARGDSDGTEERP
jgi:ABC-2 type transport system ATP-binding protein